MKKYSIIFTIILLLLCSSSVSGANRLEVHFIDVGQGDAIFIKTPSGKNALIDAGNLSAGHRVRQYLKSRRVSTLDAVIITHMHPDHVGGLFCLVPDLAVEKIYDNGAVLIGYDFWEEYINLIKNLKIKREILEEGDEFSFGRVKLRVLSPSKPLIGDMNGDSIVIKISYGKIAFLLTGDLNKKGEKRLLARKLNLRSQVLKVGHHGADDATSEAFLEEVNPLLAVISVGKNNPYGYPGEKTLHLLKRKGVNLFRTDLDGTVVVRTDGERFSVMRK